MTVWTPENAQKKGVYPKAQQVSKCKAARYMVVAFSAKDSNSKIVERDVLRSNIKSIQ
jgi:hypothetical protein